MTPVGTAPTLATSRSTPALGNGGALPLVTIAPDFACQATVIVPANDEADGIIATLAALAAQTDLAGRPLDPCTFEIIVLANNCRDDTAAIARQFADQRPELALHVVERTLPAAEANVGTARRLLMDEAARRLLSLGRPRGVIASTDADTRPAPTWLAATQREIDAGADAVGGRILTATSERRALDEGMRLSHLRDVGYRFLLAEVESLLDPRPHDPWPRHYQHFGASIAVTATAYRQIGGLPRVPALEDVGLSLALDLADARLRHSPAVRVVTSARMSERTVRGFATQFREWGALHASRRPVLVESAASITARIAERGQLRTLWQQLQVGSNPSLAALTALAGRLRLPTAWLNWQLATAPTFGQLELSVRRQQGRRTPFEATGPLQPIDAATRDLRLLVARLRRERPHLLLAREEIEPIRLRPLPTEMVQDVAATVEEFLVDLVGSQRRVIDRGRPMDQQELAAGG